jgi:hypothetical protein
MRILLLSLLAEGIPFVKHGLGLLSSLLKQSDHQTLIINVLQFRELGNIFTCVGGPHPTFIDYGYIYKALEDNFGWKVQ